MSNNKPIAVAVIKFYPNKHIEIELDSIAGVTPRTLAIAENLLSRKYRAMKGKFIVNEHIKARKAKKDAEEAAEKKEREFHEEADRAAEAKAEEAVRLAEEAAKIAEEEAKKAAKIAEKEAKKEAK